jgi:hypothetical protein
MTTVRDACARAEKGQTVAEPTNERKSRRLIVVPPGIDNHNANTERRLDVWFPPKRSSNGARGYAFYELHELDIEMVSHHVPGKGYSKAGFVLAALLLNGCGGAAIAVNEVVAIILPAIPAGSASNEKFHCPMVANFPCKDD